MLTFGEHARALLYNGLGQHAAALAPAQSASARDELMVSVWALPELVEAASRCGKGELAADAFERLAERTRVAGTDLALGIEARARALVSEGALAEELYREALDRLGRCRLVLELARAHLLYGEWLRREQRRVEAREQLRTAHEMFVPMGAEAFAERARRELLATGETVRARTPDTREQLTAQEAQMHSLPATDCPTRRSRRGSSLARARSNTTCARCSRSWTSARETSYIRVLTSDQTAA